MENRLKERLTGAAILVALIVLLVPEMFHGQHTDVASSAASSGEGPPVRSYTIDLSNGPTRTAPLQTTQPANAPDAAADTKASAPTAPPAIPATSSPPKPATQLSAAAVAAAVTPTPSGPALKPSIPGAGAGWSVQLGLFAQRDNAERLMHAAQTKGFAASVSDRDPKGLYHVHLATVSDRAAAQTLQQRLRDQGFQAAVVPPAASGSKTQQ